MACCCDATMCDALPANLLVLSVPRIYATEGML